MRKFCTAAGTSIYNYLLYFPGSALCQNIESRSVNNNLSSLSKSTSSANSDPHCPSGDPDNCKRHSSPPAGASFPTRLHSPLRVHQVPLQQGPLEGRPPDKHAHELPQGRTFPAAEEEARFVHQGGRQRLLSLLTALFDLCDGLTTEQFYHCFTNCIAKRTKKRRGVCRVRERKRMGESVVKERAERESRSYGGGGPGGSWARAGGSWARGRRR